MYITQEGKAAVRAYYARYGLGRLTQEMMIAALFWHGKAHILNSLGRTSVDIAQVYQSRDVPWGKHEMDIVWRQWEEFVHNEPAAAYDQIMKLEGN